MTANPRYPHTILITRSEATGVYDPFNPPTATVTEIYHDEGRNYLKGVTNPENGVLTSDNAVSIPFIEIDVKAGDYIKVTERVRVIEGEVVDAYLSNLGLTVYWKRTNT